MKMDSAKNGKWIFPFKKLGMVRVKMDKRFLLLGKSPETGIQKRDLSVMT